MCTVVNLKQNKFNVYIGRSGYGRSGQFGNPFIVGRNGARGECVELFRAWFHSPAGAQMRLLAEQQIKKGDVLGCFCKPLACHGDVIAAHINSL